MRRNITTATSGLKHNWITALAQVGNEWLVGTYGAGVLRLAADGSVTPTEATRQGVVVNPAAMAADGRIVLAGTLGEGLLVGDATGMRWKTITAGLPSLNDGSGHPQWSGLRGHGKRAGEDFRRQAVKRS